MAWDLKSVDGDSPSMHGAPTLTPSTFQNVPSGESLSFQHTGGLRQEDWEFRATLHQTESLRLI